MAMANMNLIGVFVTKLWPVQALACGGDGGDGGGATKTIISPKFSNFGDIIIMYVLPFKLFLLHSCALQFEIVGEEHPCYDRSLFHICIMYPGSHQKCPTFLGVSPPMDLLFF